MLALKFLQMKKNFRFDKNMNASMSKHTLS